MKSALRGALKNKFIFLRGVQAVLFLSIGTHVIYN
jgi:hypothetical protein